MLAYLSRYTHRVAISNRRLIAFDHNGVTFKYKDYRADGRARYKRMTLAPQSFRVGEDVTIPTPHSSGRADFPHPVLHGRASLTLV